ncbi:hypothetical protein IFU40_12580 [Microbacterium sp. CFBP 13617]|uniref:hypothetical protein n=1 Tax=Microbacterium sp. CFBP 13617 TaxID=2774035 RepID=UPI001786EA27|nr:hypothetical protein [Microbacterium sp. CFBP 13617]MBD8219469.1 hypothetical protein [Microbacterium sp. CFBP 13617]
MSMDLPPGLAEVLDSAVRLQELVPDAVLVGGSAAASYARHRMSTDHDHVLADLQDRFDLVLDALERDGDFVLNRAVPGKIILGELGGIEAGVRQLIRRRPLEMQRVTLPSGGGITVPTVAEIARIKGFLIVKRNQMRDYLDVAALSGAFGDTEIGGVLAGIDEYYTDPSHPEDRPVQAQLARQLASPAPKDQRAIAGLAAYKGLVPRWRDWDDVVTECRALSVHLI